MIWNIFLKNQTTDDDLYRLADMMHIPNLRICYAAQIDSHYDGPQIVNLDRVGGEGTHWCAYWRNTYFDPLGCPPPPAIERLHPDYNEIQIQNVHEAHCGQYAIIFLFYLQRDKLAEFYNDFPNHN